MEFPRGTATAGGVTVLLLLITDAATMKLNEGISLAYDLSTLARWLYILNGDYTAQVTTKDAEGNTVTFQSNFSVFPIKVPEIEDPTTLMKVTEDGVSRCFLVRWTEDLNGVGLAQLYSVPESDVLQSIHDRGSGKEPLILPVGTNVERLDNCKGTFEQLEYAFFSGSWIDCMSEVNGENPLYSVFVTCDGFVHIKNVGDSSVIYNYVKQGDSYPLVPEVQNKLKDISNPCSLVNLLLKRK